MINPTAHHWDLIHRTGNINKEVDFFPQMILLLCCVSSPLVGRASAALLMSFLGP